MAGTIHNAAKAANKWNADNAELLIYIIESGIKSQNHLTLTLS